MRESCQPSFGEVARALQEGIFPPRPLADVFMDLRADRNQLRKWERTPPRASKEPSYHHALAPCCLKLVRCGFEAMALMVQLVLLFC